MVRAKIIVSGRVQKAGYKDTVDEIAYHLNLKGYVKNLEDGTVEVVCEGEKKDIGGFVEKIKVREYPIFVESVKVKYSEETGEFKQFDIIHEKDITKATYERMDMAARYMRGMHTEMKDMHQDLGGKIDSMHQDLGGKIDSMHQDLKEEQIGMHHDMNKRFDWIAEKYGDIGAGIASIKDDLKELKNMRNDVKEMKNLFAKLVNHFVKE